MVWLECPIVQVERDIEETDNFQVRLDCYILVQVLEFSNCLLPHFIRLMAIRIL